MYKQVLGIMLSLLLVACAPKPIGLQSAPEGPPDYRQGWQDGCDTALGTAYSNTFYKTFYSFTMDVDKRVNSKDYSVGWKDGDKYCRHYAKASLREGLFATGPNANALGGPGDMRDSRVGTARGFTMPNWDIGPDESEQYRSW